MSHKRVYRAADSEGSLRLVLNLPASSYAALIVVAERRNMRDAAELVEQLVEHALKSEPKIKRVSRLTDEQLAKIIELKRLGLDAKQIARHLGVTPEAVKRRLKRLSPGL